MRILHTSDWHLGRSLHGRKRYREFSAFLDWLVQTIAKEQIDALLVAGDVFDTSTPSNRAQQLYYQFLCRIASSCCRHVVIIAGNHDSPSFLNAPKELLRALNVHVIGAITDTSEDEVIVLHSDDKPQAIVCAVPYLHDRDIRIFEPGESIDSKNRKLVEGIRAHYAEVVKLAEQKRHHLTHQSKIPNQKSTIQNQKSKIPIIALGHLFTAGGKTIDGDGVRELYVGSLAHIGRDIFPASIDYLALGHLHVPQAVGGTSHIRYCGSPIAMGYGEAEQQKSVVIVDFAEDSQQPQITLLPVPCFQQLIRINGSLEEIYTRLDELKENNSTAWLEIDYTGSAAVGNLREMLDKAVAGSALEILRIKNRLVMDRVLNAVREEETLDDLDINDVFERCLDAFAIPAEEREGLKGCYDEVVRDLREEDGGEF